MDADSEGILLRSSLLQSSARMSSMFINRWKTFYRRCGVKPDPGLMESGGFTS